MVHYHHSRKAEKTTQIDSTIKLVEIRALCDPLSDVLKRIFQKYKN